MYADVHARTHLANRLVLEFRVWGLASHLAKRLLLEFRVWVLASHLAKRLLREVQFPLGGIHTIWKRGFPRQNLDRVEWDATNARPVSESTPKTT